MNSRLSRLEEQTKKEKIEKKEKKKRYKEETKEIRKEKKKKIFKKTFIILFILGIITLSYAHFIEPHMLLIHEHKIETNKITNAYHGLKIVHFSDLHYGRSENSKNIYKLINQINELKPDIVVFTGDLIDDRVTLDDKEIDNLTKSLAKIDATLGKYSILGNHDMNTPYSEKYQDIFYKSDFSFLINNYDLIYKDDNHPIFIYGLDDTYFGDPNFDSIKDLNLEDNTFKILLLHEPDYIKEVDKDMNIDLALAGHSHNGQVKIPFIRPLILPEGSRAYYGPYYKVGNTDLFVSNGVGTSLLSLRLFSIPSINLYRITKPN